MAWIESHQSLAHHPKTLRLCEVWKCTRAEAIGYLHLLWYWTLDYAPDGVISPAAQVLAARECDWQKRPETFWAALEHAGFVQHGESPCALYVHDWMDYAGRLIERRRINTDRKRRARSAGRPVDKAGDGQGTGAVTDAGRHGATVNRTVNPTGPDPSPLPPSVTAEGGCCVLGVASHGAQHSNSCRLVAA